LERQQEKEREAEEARRRQQEEEEQLLRHQSEALWLQEQERRLIELKEQELMKNTDPSQINTHLPPDYFQQGQLNNQKPTASSGSLVFVPNKLDDGSRSKVEKNLLVDPLRPAIVPSIPDRDLKKNLVISDSSEG